MVKFRFSASIFEHINTQIFKVQRTLVGTHSFYRPLPYIPTIWSAANVHYPSALTSLGNLEMWVLWPYHIESVLLGKR